AAVNKVANFIRGDSTAIAPEDYFLRPAVSFFVGRAGSRARLAYPHATRMPVMCRGSSRVSPTLSLSGLRSKPSSTDAGGALTIRTLIVDWSRVVHSRGMHSTCQSYKTRDSKKS